jgi:hypothetical protein
MGSGDKAPRCIDEDEWSASRSGCFIPGIHWLRPAALLGVTTKRKSAALAENRIPTVQLMARYPVALLISCWLRLYRRAGVTLVSADKLGNTLQFII